MAKRMKLNDLLDESQQASDGPLPAIVVGGEFSVRADAQDKLQLEDFGAETEKTNAKRRDRFLAAMGEAKLLGKIDRIVAVDVLGRRTFDSTKVAFGAGEGEFVNPAHAFANWVLSKYRSAIRVTPYGHSQVLFYGLDVKPLFRLLGPSCIVDADFPVPLGLWYAVDSLDPYEMLVESEYRLQVPLQKVLLRGKLRLSDGYRLHADAEADCQLAMELCTRFALFPFPFSVG